MNWLCGTQNLLYTVDRIGKRDSVASAHGQNSLSMATMSHADAHSSHLKVKFQPTTQFNRCIHSSHFEYLFPLTQTHIDTHGLGVTCPASCLTSRVACVLIKCPQDDLYSLMDSRQKDESIFCPLIGKNKGTQKILPSGQLSHSPTTCRQLEEH